MTSTEARFILGLGPSFSPEELKRAYRKAAAENHPDRGGNTERMLLVNEAFETLSPLRPSDPFVESSDHSAPGPEATAQSWSAENAQRPGPQRQESRWKHPLTKYVVGISFALGLLTWLSFLIWGNAKDRSDWWTMALLGLPIYWVGFYFFVHTLFVFGIHVYNLRLRILNWLSSQGLHS